MPKNSLSINVAKLIAQKRKTYGITQAEMAEKLNLEKETISRIENGRIAISLDRLAEFANVLNCTPQDILMSVSSEFLIKLDPIICILEPLAEKEQDILLRFMQDSIQLFLDQKK